MLGQLCNCDTIAISKIYAEAAMAVEQKKSPAEKMDRLLNILENAHSGGRLSDPKRLYQALDSMLHTEQVPALLADCSEPLSLALELHALEPIPQYGKIFTHALGV